VCSDKHMPTLRAVLQAGYRGVVLDSWHGFKAISEFLVRLQVLGPAAAAIDWAFRLYRRSSSDAKAIEMRDAFVNFILDHCADGGGSSSSSLRYGAVEAVPNQFGVCTLAHTHWSTHMPCFLPCSVAPLLEITKSLHSPIGCPCRVDDHVSLGGGERRVV
jgi:hypothetical protein